MSSRGSDICWRDQISVQISADIFADICKYLHISADICKYLQISADVCRYLHKASRYNIIEAQLTMQSISYYTDSSLCPHLALPHCHHCCTIVRSPCPSTSIQPFATIPLLSGWAPEQQRQKFNLSPTGSTVSVKNDTDPSTRKSDPFDSPFVGNVKFTVPTQRQRLPLSALFLQAFVVQPNFTSKEGLVNVRWVQT